MGSDDSTSSPPAYLFDAYPHPRTSHIIVWIKHGKRVSKRKVAYQPTMCIKAEHEPLEVAERILGKDDRVETFWHDTSRLWLRGPEEAVLRIRPKRFQDMQRIATDLRRATYSKGYTFYDVDNQAESRWMHEHGLWPMCRLAMEEGHPLLEPADDEDRFTHQYDTPDLRTVHLRAFVDAEGTCRDVEGFSDDLLAIQIHDQLIEVGTIGEPAAEQQALLELRRLLTTLDPDIIFTQHGDRFDIPYLLSRIRKYDMHESIWLGREPDPVVGDPDQKGKSIHTYGRWLYKTDAYYLKGRWHIDLSKKTLDSESDRKDIHGILYLCRVSNRRGQDVNRNGAGYALQQMQIDSAQDMGVAIPWKRNLVEDWKDAATLCAVDRGGQIMVPTPGIYGDVAACDFSGYYPSLIVEHNLSSDSINCTCCPNGPIVPELGYHLCEKQRGHQAGVLERLNSHRRWAKSVLKAAKKKGSVEPDLIAKAQAIRSEHKALGVVCFGYFRYRNARFGCAEIHQAIQCYGRAGMTEARRVINADGGDLVHAMTDCTFIQKPGIDRPAALRIARKISMATGVQMDLEGVYKWVVFLPSKVHSHSEPGAVGVPNRYYGKFIDDSMKFRGIEVQRHSTPDWVHDIQQRMLSVLEQADTPDQFRSLITAALEVAKVEANRLRRREVDPRTLGTMVQATREVEDYAAATNTRSALLRLRDAGTERKPGEYVKYVVARHDGPKESRVVPVELFDSSSPWFGELGITYHAMHYLRLLARSIETILAPFGYWEEAVFEWLIGKRESPLAVPTRRVDVPARPVWVRN